jgi:hypothetical protein
MITEMKTAGRRFTRYTYPASMFYLSALLFFNCSRAPVPDIALNEQQKTMPAGSAGNQHEKEQDGFSPYTPTNSGPDGGVSRTDDNCVEEISPADTIEISSAVSVTESDSELNDGVSLTEDHCGEERSPVVSVREEHGLDSINTTGPTGNTRVAATSPALTESITSSDSGSINAICPTGDARVAATSPAPTEPITSSDSGSINAICPTGDARVTATSPAPTEPSTGESVGVDMYSDEESTNQPAPSAPDTCCVGGTFFDNLRKLIVQPFKPRELSDSVH